MKCVGAIISDIGYTRWCISVGQQRLTYSDLYFLTSVFPDLNFLSLVLCICALRCLDGMLLSHTGRLPFIGQFILVTDLANRVHNFKNKHKNNLV